MGVMKSEFPPGLTFALVFIFLIWSIFVHYKPWTSHNLLTSVPSSKDMSFPTVRTQLSFQVHMTRYVVPFYLHSGTSSLQSQTPHSYLILPRATNSGHARGHLLFLSTQLCELSRLCGCPVFRISLQPAGEDQQIRKSCSTEIVKLVRFKSQG